MPVVARRIDGSYALPVIPDDAPVHTIIAGYGGFVALERSFWQLWRSRSAGLIPTYRSRFERCEPSSRNDQSSPSG
jgi:hypothetical protein